MSQQTNAAPVKSWLIEPFASDVAQSIDRLRRSDDVCYLAVMPDVHLASDVCVGVALATNGTIYPAAVGGDIGCGMAAIAFNTDAEQLADKRSAGRVLAGLHRLVPATKHSREQAPAALPTIVPSAELSDPRLQKLAERDGRYQLGTLGRGNHFIEFQADEQNRLWLMVHSGSRGMGQSITSLHLARARSAGQRDRLVRFSAKSPGGQAYLQDVAWAISYANENRLAMIESIGRLFGELFQVDLDRESLIHSNHNHVRQETHNGQTMWVHRKGALSAAMGEPGVIPGSMGSASFHVTGRGDAMSLCSSSHGAGRKLSRGAAAKLISVRRVEREMQGVWFNHRQIASIRDEAPSAYKDIHTVMRAQRELTRIDRQLRPLLNYKGV